MGCIFPIVAYACGSGLNCAIRRGALAIGVPTDLVTTINGSLPFFGNDISEEPHYAG